MSKPGLTKKHLNNATMSKQKPAAEKQPQDPFFKKVAEIYEVPVTGITAIDKQPYLNKDGRLFLLHKMRKVKAIRVEYIKYSTTLIEPSICKKIIELKGQSFEAVGEASQDSVGKSSIRHTLNMMAETRALNRAIWLTIGADVMEQVKNNLETMEITDEDKARIIEAGRSSYEEMERPTNPGDVDEKTKELYARTVERIDGISDSIKALEECLKKVPTWPFEAKQKEMLETRIRGAIARLKKQKPEKPPKKKPAKKKPIKKTKKRVWKKR